MLEYDLGVQDDNKEAVASVVGKLLDHHIFQTLRTQMQVRLCVVIKPVHCDLLRSSATLRKAGLARTSRSSAHAALRHSHMYSVV